MRQREDLFNGTRYVAVAVSSTDVNSRVGSTHRHFALDPIQQVADALGSGYDVFPVNHSPLGENVAWPELTRRSFISFDPDIFTFYGHAKGVTHQDDPPNVMVWTAVMYSSCLDYWPHVEDLLKRYSVAGSIRSSFGMNTVRRVARRVMGTLIYERINKPSGHWHYSGTFFWVKNSALPGKDYNRLDPVYGGVERWPGQQFAYNESGLLYGENLILPYNDEVCARIKSDFQQWHIEHADCVREDACAQPWLTFQHENYDFCNPHKYRA